MSEPQIESGTFVKLQEELAEFNAWQWDQEYLADRLARRQFYQEHPASEISPCSRPVLPDPEELPWFWQGGELTLTTRIDPCQTWSAHLVRKAFVGKMPARSGQPEANAHALFEAKISGAKSLGEVIEAVMSAAKIAGWLV